MLEVGAVLELLFDRELEDLFADGELTVDLVLRQAEVRDVAIRLSANPYDGKTRVSEGGNYKKPTLWTALLSWSASFCLPPGASNCERSRVTRSAQSTFVNTCQLMFKVAHILAHSRSVLDSSGCRYTGSLCVTALGAICTSVAIAGLVFG